MKSNNIEQIVSILLNDEQFKINCKNNISKILKNNKLDLEDIPIILSLVIDIYNKNLEIEIKENQIKDVFQLVVLSLLDQMGLITSENTKTIENLLNYSLVLLVSQVKKLNLKKKIIKFIKKNCFCSANN